MPAQTAADPAPAPATIRARSAPGGAEPAELPNRKPANRTPERPKLANGRAETRKLAMIATTPLRELRIRASDDRDERGAGLGEMVAFLPHAMLATALIALLPTVLVWWLRAEGYVSSYPLCLVLGLLTSFVAASAGASVWKRRPASRDVVFGDLMLWRYLLRCRRELQLRSARATLGIASRAQLRLPDGLSPQRQVELFEGLACALDASDPNTHGHSRRVAHYAWVTAKRLGLAPEEVARVRAAAAMHDIGKIHTPQEILRKPGKLTEREYDVMQLHPVDGAEMAAVLHDREISSIVRHHHERLDGSGYPDGLRGEEIPLGARIVAVADTFDAITASRPYHSARAHREALAILTGEAGTKLDADVVSAFCSHYTGRRSIALWSSLSTLPTRFAPFLSPAAGSAASVAQTAAVASLIAGSALTAGSVIASVTSTHHHARGSTPAVAASSAQHPGAQTATTTADPTGRARRHHGGVAGKGAAHTPTQPGVPSHASGAATGSVGASATAAATASAASGAAEGTVAQGSTDTASAVGETAAKSSAGGASGSVVGASGGNATGAASTGAASEASSTAGTTSSHTGETTSQSGETGSRAGEAVSKTTETVAHTVETVSQTVETVGKEVSKVTAPVTEVAGKTVETVKGVTGGLLGALSLGTS